MRNWLCWMFHSKYIEVFPLPNGLKYFCTKCHREWIEED